MSPALDKQDRALASDVPGFPVAGSQTSMAFFRQPLAPILTALAVTILVVLAITFARTHGQVAAMWGAGGVAAVVWLRAGRGLMFDLGFGTLVAVGVLVGEFLVGNGPWLALLFTGANLLEIALAVALTRRFVPGLNVNSVGGIARYLVVCIVAALPSAAITAFVIEVVMGAQPLAGFRLWWMGHLLGLVIIGILGLSLGKAHLAALRRPVRIGEGVALGLLLAGSSFVIFSRFQLPYSFLLTPLLIIVAVRFRVVGMATALLVVSVVAIAGTMAGFGPYNDFPAESRALLAQLLILLGYMPILMVAALLEERDLLMANARIRRQRAELSSAAKSRLLANVAHEIKSPVSGIIGIGDLWATGQLGEVTPTQIEMAEMLSKTARQIETLALDLLDVARAESGAVKVDLRPTDVGGVLDDVRRTMALGAETSSVRVIVTLEHEGLVVLADSQRLSQVVGNLTQNAIKYGGASGAVQVCAFWSGERVRIEVRDKGPGLSPQKQEQLFEPFNRLGLEKSSIEGHGIGLALAKRLIELQYGDIGVVSAPGEGATFWIELPAA